MGAGCHRVDDRDAGARVVITTVMATKFDRGFDAEIRVVIRLDLLN